MSERRRTALVTGATAGIGAAFARRLAADGYDLVLVARDEARLRELAAALTEQHGAAVEVLPADLTTDSGVGAVEDRAADVSGPLDILINNAGIALNQPFLRSSADDQERLLRLNVHAVMRLTRAVLPVMVARRHGAVINISSVAGFAAAQAGSTYPATKAWVNNFTESIAPTVRKHGVRVMAVCPGYVRTEFHERAGIDMSKAPSWLWLDADTVVATALRDLSRGKLLSVVDWRYRLVAGAMRFGPSRMVRAVGRRAR